MGSQEAAMASTPPKPKRGPSVLVTDSRQRPSIGSRPGTATGTHARMSSSTRPFSVDNVLMHSSQIPSGQPRVPPGSQHRTMSGGGLPTLASRTGQQNMPSRTTRISEKLVLLPETDDKGAGSDEDDDEGDEGNDRKGALPVADTDEERPLKDEERDVLRKRGGLRGKSLAERLPKPQRTDKFSRVTAYCTAQACKMKSTSEFLRKKHDAKTKLYDDCLYTVYHLPLLQGIDGYRMRSRPVLKTPGTGKTLLDLEMERSERRDEHMGYFDEYGGHDNNGQDSNESPSPNNENNENGGDNSSNNSHYYMNTNMNMNDRDININNTISPNAKDYAEMLVFSYGVVVFWNFTEQQEKNILADLAFAENESGTSLVTRPLDQGDFETEEFHFEYSADIQRPRVFNDMITLLPRSDHMVKLTISHAIAQSTKLCHFEERMSNTMLSAQHVPKRLATTGELNMTRNEIVKILGHLFKSRVDINLSSNVLDVPNFFWDSEPTLHPLYDAIREYLEIDPRIKVLNERCRVFLDLAEILSDSVADAKMSYITWIIIVLIVLSILVTVTEVVLRFTILSKERGGSNGGLAGEVGGGDGGAGTDAADLLRGSLQHVLAKADLEDLRRWGAVLTEGQRSAVCGSGGSGGGSGYTSNGTRF